MMEGSHYPFRSFSPVRAPDIRAKVRRKNKHCLTLQKRLCCTPCIHILENSRKVARKIKYVGRQAAGSDSPKVFLLGERRRQKEKRLSCLRSLSATLTLHLDVFTTRYISHGPETYKLALTVLIGWESEAPAVAA